MKAKVKFILKAVLFWGTMLSCTIDVLGIESLMEGNHWAAIFAITGLNMALICLCYNFLSYEEVCRISGTKTFEEKIQQRFREK